MKFKYLLVIVLIPFSLGLTAQKKISVDRIYATKPIDVSMPIILDSVNLKGNKFQNKDLLETVILTPEQKDFTESLSSEVFSDYFFFTKPRQGARFQLLSFQLAADRYSKAKIKVTSPGMFEVYIDNKKELTKTSEEDSLRLAKVLEKDFTMTPGTLSILIKYLSFASGKAQDGVKIAIEIEKNDTLTNFKIINKGKRNIAIEDILTGTRLTGLNISPDGRYVLLSYKSVASDGKSTSYSDLLDSKTGRRTYIGTQKMEWMPTSNLLYYTLQREDQLQLITINPETLSENIISGNIPTGNFRFSPDEKHLYYTDKESNDNRKGDLKLLASPGDRQAGYFDRYFIYKYELSNGLKQRLTFGKHSTFINDISKDSRHLLFSISKETITERPFRKSSMFRVDVNTFEVDTLWTDQTFTYSAIFSPDASKILILGAPEAFDNIGQNIKDNEIANSYDIQAFIMDIQSKNIEAITRDFAPSVDYAYWNASDNMVYLKIIDKDKESVYRYDLQKKTFTQLSLSEEVVKNFSLAAKAPYASYYGLSTSNTTRAYTVDLKSIKSTLISDPMKTTVESLNLGEVQEWNFTASDNTIVEGRFYLPPNFDSQKKYPMIVYYYGGTLPTSRTLDHPYPMHVYAALGYVVYVIQPSGSIGFGQEFSARHVNAWGKRTADDIIEGTKQFVTEHPFINDKKIGCIGASYGGFMTMYLQTQTDIFAAAVSHAGISSLSSYWGEGYWGYTYSSGASAGSYPWNNRDLYVGQSPLFSADKIKTPLLLLHGADDTNVPIGESIQMYTALKILGRPVEFIQVKGENHGIVNYKRRIEWNNSIYAWFAKWLKDDTAWWDSLYPSTEK